MTEPKLGPIGVYPFGGPIDPSDQGGMLSGFSVVPGHPLCRLEFGTFLNWFCLTRPTALSFAQSMRQMVIKRFGKLAYDVSGLPLRVIALKGRVEVHLPGGTSEIVANPHMWLALADRIEEEARKLP